MTLDGEVEDIHIDEGLGVREIEELVKEATTQGVSKASDIKKSALMSYTPKGVTDILPLVSPESLTQYQKFYVEDDIISKEGLNPPPVKKMVSVYGVNCETEMVQFYKRKPHRKGKDSDIFALDPKGSIPSYKCTGGVGYETANTTQLQPDTGLEVHASGDHTVPYCSLRYCMTWANSHGFDISVKEIEKATHRFGPSSFFSLILLIDFLFPCFADLLLFLPLFE